jgi:hypothetical protein
MTVWGLDADSVRTLARQMDGKADELERIRMSVRSSLSAAPWNGHDADRFRQEWQSTHETRLVNAVTMLRAAGNDLLRNLSQQEQTSAAGTGSITSGSSGGSVGPARLGPAVANYLNGAAASGSGVATVGADGHIQAGAEGSAYATAAHTATSASVALGVAGSVGLAASGAASVAAGPAKLGVDGKAFVGAEGNAKLAGNVGLNGAQVHGEAKAFVGAEAAAHQTASIGALSENAGAHAYAGLGVEAKGDVDLTWNKIEIGGEIGAALGVGAGVDVNISFSPEHAAHDIAKFLHW